MRGVLLSVLCLVLGACQSAGYVPAEQLGSPKLGQLVDRVEDYSDAQDEAIEQFQSTAAQLGAFATVNEGNLEATYAAALRNYNAVVQAAIAVSSALAAVDQSATAKFGEWQEEVEVYTDTRLKADNQARLGQTWQSYQSTLQVLRQSEARMNNTLTSLNDTMTFLKENLNVAAVAGHGPQFVALQASINGLVGKMKIAMTNANAFAAAIN
jgi:hypothetical protein